MVAWIAAGYARAYPAYLVAPPLVLMLALTSYLHGELTSPRTPSDIGGEQGSGAETIERLKTNVNQAHHEQNLLIYER